MVLRGGGIEPETAKRLLLEIQGMAGQAYCQQKPILLWSTSEAFNEDE